MHWSPLASAKVAKLFSWKPSHFNTNPAARRIASMS
jgi:hypothetical protein